jgi:UDP-3-O-[3-hydroxymyristoyl] glucosamine N-acyltransferase
MTSGALHSMTAAEIAAAVGGTLAGNGSVIVTAIAPLHRAGAHELSFLAGAKYAPAFEQSAVGVVLVTPELAAALGPCAARIVVPKPHEAMLSLLPKFYHAPERVAGIDPTAVIASTATIGASVRVEAFAVIGDGAVIGDNAWIGSHSVIGDGVKVGRDARLFPHVTLYSGTELGERVMIQSGARIGCDGFGYVYGSGTHNKIPHVGRCLIANDVEIGANTTVDRGSIDDTVIGAGTKIDNLCQVAHNVRIGRLCLLMSQVGVSGSTHVEDGVILAGQVGVAGHLTIGAQARVAAQGGVISDIPSGETWSGYPARPHRQALRSTAALFKLSALLKRIERMLKDAGQ